jgi:hypothetical protein
MYIRGPIVDSELYAGCFDTAAFMTDTAVVEDRFVTMPVLPAAPAYQPANEEELHTSFEQAISDRLLAVNKQLSLKSGPLAHTERLELNTEPLSQRRHHNSMTNVTPATAPLQQRSGKLLPELLGNVWQRSIIFASLTLMLMLLGFDLMGLLVLHMH